MSSPARSRGGRPPRLLLLPVLALLAALALLALPAAAAPPLVGVNDQAPLDPATLPWFYPTMGAEGLQVDTLTLRWDDTAPTTIPDQSAIASAIAAAAANGVEIEFDLYPLHSMAFTGGSPCAPDAGPLGCGNTAAISSFDAWTAQVANAFPSVHQFVVMNECNQPLFVNPQWDSSGANQSAEICGRALAGAYDALKAVSVANVVWGVGLSPRGNDNPTAATNSSTSPVAFLQDLGAWFRAFVATTGRTTPLMDGLDFHPYPIPQSQPFAQGYPSPNDASVSNLPRIYQAFYTAFVGTPQPTIGQQTGGGLPLSLNEVGVQTDETGVPGYTGTEVSANPNGGVLGATATPQYQSSWYQQMLALVVCDPNVRVVNIYHLIDEADLAGWQSGLYDVNRNPKLAAASVHDWIASTGGQCQGTLHPWTPPGLAAAAGPAPSAVSQSGPRILVAAAGRIRVYDALSHRLRRVLAPFGVGYAGPLAIALGSEGSASEIAVAEGAGGVRTVVLLNGKTGRRIGSITPFTVGPRGGLSLAFADLTGTGRDDLVVGSPAGAGATVKVFAPNGAALETLLPFGPGTSGGASVAAGSLATGGPADLVVGSGPGTSPQVVVYGGTSTTPLETLRPFSASFRGGVSVAVAGAPASGGGELVVASGPGATSVVRAYRGTSATRLWSIDAFGPSFTGGASLATFVPAIGAGPEVAEGAGSGGGAQVKVLAGATGALAGTFLGSTGSPAIALAAG